MKTKVLLFIFIMICQLYAQERESSKFMMSDDSRIRSTNSNKFNKTNISEAFSTVDSVIKTQSSGMKGKEVYLYDSKLRVITHLVQKWSEEQWRNIGQWIYEYDQNGNLTSEIYELWDGTQWVSNRAITYSYNENDELILEIKTVRDGDQLVYEWKYTYTYDDKGLLIYEFQEHWREGQWNDNQRWNYIYDNDGNLLVELGEELYDTGWENDDKFTSEYDGNGNQLSWAYVIWENSQWVGDWRWVYTYLEDGKMESWADQIWSANDWFAVSTSYYNYDDKGKLTLENVKNHKDENMYRQVHTYDARGNLMLTKGERWNEEHWNDERRKLYEYDELNNFIRGNAEELYEGQWVSESAYFEFLDSLGNEHSYNASEIDLFYSLVTDVKENTQISDFSLDQNYPNPFNPSTTISYSIPKKSQVELKVFDVLGREVEKLVSKEQSAGSYELQFSAGNLSSGVYFYRLKTNGYVKSKKMILIK